MEPVGTGLTCSPTPISSGSSEALSPDIPFYAFQCLLPSPAQRALAQMQLAPLDWNFGQLSEINSPVQNIIIIIIQNKVCIYIYRKYR